MPKPIRNRDLPPVALDGDQQIRVTLYDFGDHRYTLILCLETREPHGGFSCSLTDQSSARLHHYAGNFNRKHFESFAIPDLDKRIADYAQAKGITLPTAVA